MEPPESDRSPPRPSGNPRIIGYPAALQKVDPDAAKVVRRLMRHGFEAYLVGGCVRDLLLGRTPKDFDVATDARPHEVRELFRNSRVIGRRFRLAHVLFGAGKVVEVATFRKDPTLTTDGIEDEDGTVVVEQGPEGDPDAPPPPAAPVRVRSLRDRDDGSDLLIRHDNVFGSAQEDSLRRDFTMNALFYDIEHGEIVDYVGGIAEIERRVIRTIGEPDVRFREDPVRILRAVKFAARLDLGLEPDVWDAIVAHREDLMRSARPRLLEELLRLLRGGASRRAFWLMWESGVLAVLMPEVAAWIDEHVDDEEGFGRFWSRLDAVDAAVREDELPDDVVLLAALFFDPAQEYVDASRDAFGAAAEFVGPVTDRLAVPRRMTERLRQVLAVQRRFRAGKGQTLARRDFFADAAAVFALECAAQGMPAEEIERLAGPAHQRRPRGERERDWFQRDRERRGDRNGGRGERNDRPERTERPDRPERPERATASRRTEENSAPTQPAPQPRPARESDVPTGYGFF